METKADGPTIRFYLFSQRVDGTWPAHPGQTEKILISTSMGNPRKFFPPTLPSRIWENTKKSEGQTNRASVDLSFGTSFGSVPFESICSQTRSAELPWTLVSNQFKASTKLIYPKQLQAEKQSKETDN